MTQITDHGELDYLTPQLTADDAKAADDVRHAIAHFRYLRNTQERVRREQAEARALYEQGNRDFLTHNKPEGQS